MFIRFPACLLSIALVALGLTGRPANGADAAETLKVLLIDGQNNHNWQETTPLIKQTLEGSGRFVVTVATSPPKGADMSGFVPSFADYDVVVSNYNGDPWSEAAQRDFEAYVAGGGGFVSVHAANNAFPEWDAYNRMIGLGGWGGRDEKHGPYVRWRGEGLVRDDQPGRGGSHGRRHPFLVVVRDADHPITRGLPRSWMQAEDELYAQLRGPAQNLHVLATAYSEPATGGTGEHEPILMTIHYGKGRVFHTTLGHDTTSIKGVAFQVTLQRGTEWAATGEVTLPPVDAKTLPRDAPATRDPATLLTAAAAPTASTTTAEPIVAQQPPTPDGEGQRWIYLFNGKDLDGWVQRNGTATYRVEDRAVVGKTAAGSPNSFLCTKQDFGNFELSFEVNVDEGLNSGVQIRSRSRADFNNGRVHGPQVEIETSPGEAGYIYSEATGRNWLSKEQPIKDAYENGQWNHFLVRAVGDRLQTWINGRKIEDLTDADSFKKGFIGLQVHSIAPNEGPFQVRWRNIQIRLLADDVQLK